MENKNDIQAFVEKENEDIQKKIDYFWNDCNPEVEASIVDSIREKTLQRIQANEGNKLYLRRKVYLVAASIAVLMAIGLTYWLKVKENPSQVSIKNWVVSQNSQLPEEVEEVTLIMADVQKRWSKTDVQVSYTKEGQAKVNSKGVASEKLVKSDCKDKNSYDQLIVPKGKRSRLLLSDGTKVWVNAGTKVIYPRVFSKEKREIYVEGEVYLEVQPDAKRPFYVSANGFDVKVLGTSFNVFAYKQMPVSRVVLLEGSVEVKDQQNQTTKIVPDEMIVIEGNELAEKKKVKASDYKAWTEDVMILDGHCLSELTDRLSLFYGKKIVCDNSLSDEVVYGKLSLHDDLNDIIDCIKSMIPLYAYDKEGVIYLERK